MRKAAFTIAPRCHDIGISATYELESICEALRGLANTEATGGERLNPDLVRGLAIRAKDLVSVAMSVLDGAVDEHTAHLTVFGDELPDPEQAGADVADSD